MWKLGYPKRPSRLYKRDHEIDQLLLHFSNIFDANRTKPSWALTISFFIGILLRLLFSRPLPVPPFSCIHCAVLPVCSRRHGILFDIGASSDQRLSLLRKTPLVLGCTNLQTNFTSTLTQPITLFVYPHLSNRPPNGADLSNTRPSTPPSPPQYLPHTQRSAPTGGRIHLQYPSPLGRPYRS